MKKNPDLSVKDILEQTAQAQAHQVSRVGEAGDDTHTPHDEQLETAMALRTMKIMGVCIACGTPAPIQEFELCVCGGMVCKPCQELEDDGTCDHERPSFLPADD